MFRSILVPLDGSPHSEQSLGLATWMARRAGANVRLCHVRELVEPGFSDSAVEDEAAVLAHFEEYLGVLARRMAADLGHWVGHRVSVGAPVTGLIHIAREERADLIILTTHGHGGPAQAWLGGTAEGLACQAGIPLLLLRPTASGGGRPEGFRRILVPLDGSCVAEGALPAAAALASLDAAVLHLLAVVELPVRMPGAPGSESVWLSGVPDPGSARDRAGAYLERVASGLRASGHEVVTEVRDAIGPATAILQAVADNGVGAIAMATHGRTRLRRMAVGSVSDKVIRAAGVPVLLVPTRDGEAKTRPDPGAVPDAG